MPALGGFDDRTRITQMIRISTDFIFNVLRRDGTLVWERRPRRD